MDFSVLKVAVAKQFSRLQQYQMFRVSVDKDLLWNTYLDSFPAGSNPMYRKRREYDCACCRQFIRAVGNVVAVVDGEVVSIWDIPGTGSLPYDVVANAMNSLVKYSPIAEPFLHYEKTAGTDKNFEQITGEGPSAVQVWNHFFVNIDPKFVLEKAKIPTKLSGMRSTHDVLLRSLKEITDDAVTEVLDLIAQGSVYRGKEFEAPLQEFQRLKGQFKQHHTHAEQDIFAWTASTFEAVARMRNTAIGTFLVDLSEGKDVNDALGAFEHIMAPANYKRTTAPITKAMIAKAKETLTELGLVSALERRHAKLTDISVNNILFADRSARAGMTGDVFDDLASGVGEKVKNLDKVEEVSIEKFLMDIVPRAAHIEVLLENRHQGNLVSLIAPCDPTAGKLFKWDNGFSWSYNGELADSDIIKERVKAAGGNVTGELCCRLAWQNYDDLDFHMVEPSGYEIFYRTKLQASPRGGRLDVDMNAGGGQTREPVENIFYPSLSRLEEGEYHLFVHQFRQLEFDDVGFEVDIDVLGDVRHCVYDKRVQGSVTVARLQYSKKDGLRIIESLPSTQTSRDAWGVPTQKFHRCNVLMLSPNHWDGHGVGNRHYFFMLDGVRTEGAVRGIYNEFLREDLNKHRKVFEVIGSKTKPAESDEQLSGLGFSTTQRNTLICRVSGSIKRTLKVLF